MKIQHEVLIIGAGTAGLMTAAQLRKRNPKLDIALVDPASTHYYQPAWTLVGAGTYDYQSTARPMASLIPKGVRWYQDKATAFDPKSNCVMTEANGEMMYKYLIVAPGLVYDYTLIEGLAEALETEKVCSNYIDPRKTWEVIRNFRGGNAVFTQPTTPIKCGGAPQKIAYLAADYFRKNKLDNASRVVFATPGSVIFAVKPIADTLMEVIHRYGIYFKTFYAPVKIDPSKQVVHFKHTANGENQCIVNEDKDLGEQVHGESMIEMPYDMLHLAPPQTAPKFIQESPLANEAGWLHVNQHSLQHHEFPNIFGLGDVASLPTAKTGAAIRKQVPVVVENLMQMMRQGKLGEQSYLGYSSCPLVTAYGKMVLAEFDYDKKFTPDPKLKRLLIKDSSKEHWRLWALKKYGLPYLYWNKMLKGQQV